MKNSSTSSLFRSGFLLALVSLFLAITGQAATLTVTNLNDNGPGSLRNAIAIAVSGDTIDLTGVNGTITLTSGELGIDKSLIIQGPGANVLTISGNNTSRVFNISNSNANVTLSGLTIANGKKNGGEGGGVYNNGALTVTNSTLSSNSAQVGGGIRNNGVLTVTNTTFSGNVGGFGGAISNVGTLTVTNSTLSGNSAQFGGYGGGINNGGTLTLTNSTLSGNSGGVGGGIFNRTTLTVTNSTLSGNSATFGGGGIFNDVTTVTLQNSIVLDGIYGSITSGSNNNITSGTAADAGLDPAGLKNNGGPTQTIALLPGSPALGAGSVALAVDADGNPLATDQRGTGFARLRNGTVDIGAYQVQLPAAPTFVGGTPAVSVPQNGSLDLTTLNLSPAGGTFSGDGVTGTNGTTFDPSQLAIGVYGITYTITDAYGNKASADFTISVTEKQSLVVTTASDTSTNVDGQISLREAIAYAQFLGGTQTITFANTTANGEAVNFYDGGPHTIILNGTELAINSSVTVQGPGAGVLTIDGNHSSRVFYIGLTNSGPSVVALSALTIANGMTDGLGGGIDIQGILTLTDGVVSGNSAEQGGGIFNGGVLILTNSTLSGNFATNAGGGLYSQGYAATVTNSTLSGNSGGFGGGISNNQGTLTVTDSTVSGNSVSGSGGGIFNQGTLTVTDSTLSGNSAVNNSGGGIANQGTLAVTNSTLSGNSGGFGGGIYNNGALTVTNSTLSGNSGGYFGGGIYINGTTTLLNSIALDGIFGSITSGSNNITSGTAAEAGLEADSNGNPILKNNGGPTQTIALLPGSPAIDAGSGALAVDADGNPLTTDQRGFNRVVNSTVDIGAFEAAYTTVTGPATAPAFGSNVPVTATVANASATGGTVQFVVDGVNYGDPIPVVNGTASASIAGLNAGDYQITALYTNGSGSPEGNANTITQTVVKATAGITFGQLIFTYDGQPKPVTATTSPAGLTVNIVYGNSPTAPTNAGSYPVTATIADANYTGSKTDTVTVNKADATISVTGYNVTYDGAPHTATGSATGIGGVPLSGLNLANTTQTNAGNYNDTWTFTDTTGNYNAATGSVKSVINKAPTNTSLTGPTSVPFAGSPLTPYTATVTGPGLNQSVPVSYSNNVNPGQATASASYPGADNYLPSSAVSNFEILQTVANVALGQLSFTYDGLPKPVTATADLANVAISVTYNGSTTAPTDAGSYAIVATVTTPGYTGSATGTLVIGKASLIVTANNAARFYGAANPTFSASYSGFVNNQTLATSGVTGAPVLTTTATKYSAVGSYPISIAPGNLTATNYTFNLVSGTLKVSLGGIAGLSSASVGSGNTVVDSYNSALGYPASKGSSAVVLSNGTVAIKGAQINGSIVSAGADLNLDNKSLVTGDAVYATSVKNQGSVGGALLKQSIGLFTAPVPPASGTFTPAPTTANNWISGDFKYDAKKGDLEISGGKTAVLTSGVYYLNGLKLSGGATLKVSGAVVIYLNDKLELSGGSMANTANLPGSLQILSSYTGKDGVKLSGNASVYAAIYAPGTDASLSGNAELFGGLLGKTLDISGNSAVHYDTALSLNWATFPR